MVTGFKSILVKFLIFAAISLALLALLYNTMINGLPGGSREFTADFTNASGLATGDDVRVAGVRVGQVKSIDLGKGNKDAQVTFQLVDQQPILTNTRVVMRYANLIGQRYLSLVQPQQHGTPLQAGATIPTSMTDPGFDLTELLNGFRPLLNVLNPADVNKLANNLIQVLQGEGPSVAQLLTQTNHLTNFLADRDQIFGQVLTNLTPVLRDLAGQGGQLRTTVHQLRLLMSGLAADRSKIGNSISGLSHLITNTSDMISQIRPPAELDVHLLREVATTLDQQRFELTAALKAFGVLFGDLGRASSYRNAVNIYLCTAWAKVGSQELNLSGHQNGGPWTKVCQ